MVNRVLLEFEATTGLGPTYAARLLGVAYVTYAQYRSGHRDLQLYHARHIEALSALSRPALQRLIREYANGSA